MRSLQLALRLSLFALILIGAIATMPTVFAAPCEGATPQVCPSAPTGCISARDLCILEPVPGGVGVIPAGATGGFLGAFFYYVNNGVWQWAFGLGVGLAVFNGARAGLQIVLSNGDSGKIEAGKTRFLWSTVGLIILLLSGVILEFLNPFGFTNI